MNKSTGGMIMFFIAAILIYAGGYIYIAWRINAGLHIKNPYNIYIYVSFTALALLSMAAFLGSRNGFPFISVIGPFGYICMGVWAISLCFFIINDALNLFNLIFKIQNFRYYSTLITIGISVLAGIWSLLTVALFLDIKEIKIKVPSLPVDSLRIVQISDVHINTITSPELIKKIFAKVPALNPDIILITGDMIDTDINRDNRYLAYGFEQLKAPYGVYAVTGNHEYYTSLSAYLEMFDKLGFKVLKNENIFIEGLVNVAGINDTDWNDAGSIKQALAAVNPQYPVLFMSHRPESFDIAAAAGEGKLVQFSGHTHAGQIPPIRTIRKYFMKYNYGIYEKDGSAMYVTSGTRWWGPPMRLFNKSEIAVIDLVKE